MRAFLKRKIPKVVDWRNRLYNYWKHYRFKGRPVEETFRIIYDENHWNDTESRSGTGSNRESARAVVKMVEEAIQILKIKTLVDIPCGDFNWMQDVNLEGIKYTGADVVEELIDRNSRKYASDMVQFKILNIMEPVLPKVDLIFSRDCLVHFSYEDIKRSIHSVKSSGSRYWMTTTFPNHKNYNIITGDWRPINLQGAPFFLPSPVHLFNEKLTEDDRYLDKSLGIWDIDDI